MDKKMKLKKNFYLYVDKNNEIKHANENEVSTLGEKDFFEKKGAKEFRKVSWGDGGKVTAELSEKYGKKSKSKSKSKKSEDEEENS